MTDGGFPMSTKSGQMLSGGDALGFYYEQF